VPILAQFALDDPGQYFSRYMHSMTPASTFPQRAFALVDPGQYFSRYMHST